MVNLNISTCSLSCHCHLFFLIWCRLLDLGKVHDPACVGVHGDSPGQVHWVAVLTVVAVSGALTAGEQVITVMFLLHQMVPGPEGHQVSVVGRGWDGHGSGAPDVGVAQLVCEDLQLVSVEAVVIPKDVVVAGPGGALDASV